MFEAMAQGARMSAGLAPAAVVVTQPPVSNVGTLLERPPRFPDKLTLEQWKKPLAPAFGGVFGS